MNFGVPDLVTFNIFQIFFGKDMEINSATVRTLLWTDSQKSLNFYNLIQESQV